MRILYFDFITHYGGAPRSSLELAERLKSEHEFIFADPYGTCQEHVQAIQAAGFELYVISPDVRHVTIGGRGRPAYRSWRIVRSLPGLWILKHRLRHLVRALKPDVIWTGSFKGLAFAHAATAGTDVAVAHHVRQSMCDHSLTWNRRAHLARASVILSLSPSITRSLVNNGVDRTKIFDVPNVIEINQVNDRVGAYRIDERTTAGRGIRILLPGTLVPRKGHACAIRACADLRDAGEDVELWLAGDISGSDGELYAQSLKKLVSSLGLDERVRFLGWRNDISSLIQASTITVLPSHDEGVARVLLEAMALSRPVISTPVGGTPDLIIHEDTGWLHPVDDHEAMSSCIVAALDANKRDQVVTKALQHVKDNNSAQRQVTMALAAFEAAKRSRSPAR